MKRPGANGIIQASGGLVLLALAAAGCHGCERSKGGEVDSRTAAASATGSAKPSAPSTPPAGWVTHANAEGGYTVWLPGEPERLESVLLNYAERWVDDPQSPTREYRVGYRDLPGIAGGSPKIVLASMTELILQVGENERERGRERKLAAPVDTSLDGHPGCIVAWTGPDKSDTRPHETRFFVANERVYVLTAMGVSADERARFFDSFRITSAPPPFEWKRWSGQGVSLLFPEKPAEDELTAGWNRGLGESYALTWGDRASDLDAVVKEARESLGTNPQNPVYESDVVASEVLLDGELRGRDLRWLHHRVDGSVVYRGRRWLNVSGRTFEASVETFSPASRDKFLTSLTVSAVAPAPSARKPAP